MEEQLRLADEWAQRYYELEQQLAESSSTDKLAAEAEEALHAGDLEKAKSLLLSSIDQEEQHVARSADAHYRVGLVSLLQFDSEGSRSHLEISYRYRPDDPRYCYGYSWALYKGKFYKEADPVVTRCLKLARDEVSSGKLPVLYTEILMTAGKLYTETLRLDMAEDVFLELQKYQAARVRGQGGRVAMADLADASLKLGDLYNFEVEVDKAEKAYELSIDMYEQLAADNPAFLFGSAFIHRRLGEIYVKSGKFKQAQAASARAVEIMTELDKVSHATYQFGLANAQYDYGLSLFEGGDLKDAEPQYAAAINTFRQASEGAIDNRAVLAEMLGGAAQLHLALRNIAQADKDVDESIDIYQAVVKVQPDT